MAITQFFNVPVCAELIAFTVSIFALSSERAMYWRLFIVYLLITLGVEFTGFYMKMEGLKTNSVVYNGLIFIQIIFFGFLFNRFHSSSKSRHIVIAFTGILFCFFLVESIIKAQEAILFSVYHKNSRLALGIYVVLFSCSFFLSMIKSDHIKNPLQHPPFWIVTGLFFYYFGSFVLFAFRDKVKEMRLAGDVLLFEIIMATLCVVLYGCWVIGFLRKRKQIQWSRQS